jgi:hypothetical protein
LNKVQDGLKSRILDSQFYFLQLLLCFVRCVCTRKECPFVASDAIPSNSSDKGSQKKLNKSIPLRLFRPHHHNPPENRPAPGKPPRTGVWH